MGRTPRIDIVGYWYHVIARGQRKESLFLEKADYNRYLMELNNAMMRGGGNLGAYCLMPNHVHLLIERCCYPLSKIIQILHSRYSRYFNNKYGKVGHVFQGRYGAKTVLKNRYLDQLIRYIHHNPVRAGLVKKPNQYSWSSDQFYRRKVPDVNIRLIRVPGYEGREGAEKYKRLIDSGLSEIPQFKDYVGYKGEEIGINRRKQGRSGRCFCDHRKFPSIKERLRELCDIEGIKVSALKSRHRLHKIAKLRSKIMAILYGENYFATEISRELNRTPASVYRVLERK